MSKKSAGILLYRKHKDAYEFFLVHPGGPFWSKKDLNSWSIPKGELDDNEDAFAAAKREFKEETGHEIGGEFIQLEPVKQSGGKMVYAWAVEGELDETKIKSNLFKLEWPIKSGKFQEFPEIDKAQWFSLEIAIQKILKGQIPLLENLINMLSTNPSH